MMRRVNNSLFRLQYFVLFLFCSRKMALIYESQTLLFNLDIVYSLRAYSFDENKQFVQSEPVVDSEYFHFFGTPKTVLRDWIALQSLLLLSSSLYVIMFELLFVRHSECFDMFARMRVFAARARAHTPIVIRTARNSI